MSSSILLGASSTGIMDEEQLRTAYGLQSAILEAAVDAIIAIDDKGLIRHF
jgi:c-di-GMP phosphodiesterase